MLALRPNCECCDRELPPDSADAVICTFECTWCRNCAETHLGNICPNCGGNLMQRPARPAHLIEKYPPSRDRVLSSLPLCEDLRRMKHTA